MNKYQEYKELGLCRRCGAEPLEGKTRCQKCHEKHLEYGRRAKEKALSAGLCRTCLVNQIVEGKSQCQECLDATNQRERDRYQQWREECIQRYGGCCSCCGLTCQKYLQLDHVNDDGADHRREIANGRGGSLYKWAVANDFPNRLQLLCANCHQAKTVYGGCSPEDHEAMRCCHE